MPQLITPLPDGGADFSARSLWTTYPGQEKDEWGAYTVYYVPYELDEKYCESHSCQSPSQIPQPECQIQLLLREPPLSGR